MRHSRCPLVAMRARWLLRLCVTLLLAGCASWTPPANPTAVFAAAASTCQYEVAQAVVASGQFDLDEDHAYTACMRRSGWDL